MELLPFERARITEIAGFYTYCDRAVWIAKRLGIKAPPSIPMFEGTVMHDIILFAEKNVHKFAKEDQLTDEKTMFQKLRNYFYDHIQEMRHSPKSNNINRDIEHFDENQLELIFSDVIDQMTYRYFNRYFNCIALNNYSMGKRGVVREKTLKCKYKDTFIVGTPDLRDQYFDKKDVLLDYKRSKDPKISEYMKMQALGYKFLIKRALNINVEMAIFEFPLYNIQRFYKPVDDYIPYLDGFINDLSKDTPPYYFESKEQCQWCNKECKNKCLELR